MAIFNLVDDFNPNLTNLVRNGEFKSGIENWSDVSDGASNVSWDPSGYLLINKVNTSDNARAAQSFTTVGSQDYTLTFSYVFRDTTSDDIDVYIEGVKVLDPENLGTYSVDFTATDTSTEVGFRNFENTSSKGIDNVWVTEQIASMDLSSDQLVVALSNTAPSDESTDPTTAGNGELSNVTEIAYTNVSSRNIVTTAWNSPFLVLEDLVISAVGGSIPTFRYIYVYNDTQSGDPLIGYFDLGKEISLNEHEEILIDFDQSQGLFGNNHSIIPNETLSRSLSSLIQSSIQQDQLVVFWTVDLLFDDPNQLYMWSGIGDLELNNKTYVGVGELLQISELRESSDIAAYGATLTLSGIDPDTIHLALAEPYQGRKAVVRFGVIQSGSYSTAVTYTGEMDQMNISYTPDSVSISLEVESRLVDLQRARIRRYTDADHRSRFENDISFSFVTRLQNESLEWA
jgi:hypothetical protein